MFKTGKNAKFPWNVIKHFIKNLNYFANFRHFCIKEKDQNIPYKFPLKIANISLQKQNFPGMRLPNSTFFPCMIMFQRNFCNLPVRKKRLKSRLGTVAAYPFQHKCKCQLITTHSCNISC